jgi:hypothetical protein
MRLLNNQRKQLAAKDGRVWNAALISARRRIVPPDRSIESDSRADMRENLFKEI